MSDDLGNKLPEDLFHLLYEAEPVVMHGKAIVIVTVDSNGFGHPALLSYREVGARDRSTIRIVTFNGTTTTNNMRANGKLTVLFIDERMTYYVKGTATEIPAHRVGSSANFATMDVAITQVLKDMPGRGEEDSFLTSGVTFRDTRKSEA